MPEFDLDSFLPYQLAVIANRVSREFSTIYAERFGLTIPEWRVLVHIHSTGPSADPVSIREIHARVEMDKSKVSRAVSRLENTGLVTKTTNPTDRRLLSLALTEKGTALMAELTPLATDFEARLMDRLGMDASSFRQTLNQFLKDTP